MSSQEEVTQLLLDWSDGDRQALGKLMPLVYEELRHLARRHMREERSEHTLQTTALVHEAYLRLINQKDVRWQNRAHFFAIAAQMMRRILVDHARRHHSERRGGGTHKLSLDEAMILTDERASELIALDVALKSLAAIDERKSKVVELRFFGGLTAEETALALGISLRTVMRDWNLAQAWLYREMGAESQPYA